MQSPPPPCNPTGYLKFVKYLLKPSFSLQYIQQNIRSDCANIDKILEPPEGQDEGVWKYEHLRYADLCGRSYFIRIQW